MDTSPRDPVRRLYRAVLRLYPRAFRDRYQADLLQAFDDRRGEARFRGPSGGLRLAWLLLRDLAASIPLAHGAGATTETPANPMSDLLRDLRYSVRMLVKSPVFTAATIVTLALGIGLNAATFSVINGILLRPLAGVDAPEELVQIYRAWPGMAYGSNSIPHYQDVRDRSDDAFESVAAYYFTELSLSADGRSERLLGMLVSANFFQTFGADMALGRPFIPDAESVGPGSHPVVVLSHGFWQTRFGGDPEVVGRTVTLNGRPFEVVGVTAEAFQGPVNFAAPPLYAPLMMQRELDPGFDLIQSRGNNMMNVVGRLRDDVTIDRARQVMDALLLQLREEDDGYDEQVGHTLVLQNEAGIHPMFRDAQVGLSAVIMSVVALLLLIACVNVANLFLARARDRRQEMGVRLSLGAGRRRIVQQLLTESLIFSLLGGVGGVILARFAVRFLVAFRPPVDGPWAFAIEMDDRVLFFTFAVSLVAGLAFGLVPALQAARPDTMSAVKGEAAGKAGGSRMSRGLVVAQVAMSLVLLVGSGLFLRALQGATEIDPGFDEPRHVVIASVNPALQGYDQPRTEAFFDRLLDEVAALPGVTRVGLTTTVPLGFSGSDRGVEIPGYEFAEGERRSLFYSIVSEGYLESMGIDVVEGRTFTRQDDEAGSPVIIVNRRFAERFWPGESALGRTVQTAGQSREIVGVVETGKYRSLGEEPTEYMYFPWRELFRGGMTLVVRTPGDPTLALQRVRELVRNADPDMPLFDVRTLEDHMGVALLPARLAGSVLGIFGLLGLTLAAVGIYGVMAYSVAQRKRELGIRVALGADRERVVRMVLGEGLKLAIVGTVLGLAAAVPGARLVGGFLYDVSAFDPAAFVGVPILLIGVAALAVYLPARRAGGADPSRALRAE